MIGVVAVAALAGCTETTSSENIKTGGIFAGIEVTATSESASTVKATLKVGGDESNTYVILDKGDEMVASAGGDSKSMSAQSSGIYEAEFGTGADGTEFKVELKRPNDIPAPDSRGTLPAPFKVGTLEDNKSRKADDLAVTWDPSGTDDSMHVEVEGSCIFLYNKDIPGDSGSFTIKAGELDSTGGNMPETCDLNVTLTRSRNGTADSAYDNESWFHLKQIRKGKVTSAP